MSKTAAGIKLYEPETVLGYRNPVCIKCGGALEVRKFVDSWGPEGEPCDVSEDLYCAKCDIRWLPEYGPHDFCEG